MRPGSRGQVATVGVVANEISATYGWLKTTDVVKLGQQSGKCVTV
jgi:hypothetical protein